MSHSAQDQLLWKIDEMSFAERDYGRGKKCRTCMCENSGTIKELVLNQEDTPGTRGTRFGHSEHKKTLL